MGIAEAAYVTLLVVGSDKALTDAVTAATLTYRSFSWVLIIPLGGLAWLWWGRMQSAEAPTDDPSSDGSTP